VGYGLYLLKSARANCVKLAFVDSRTDTGHDRLGAALTHTNLAPTKN